jgi:hypothetical protein
MALKDLIASKASLTEETIEEIVSEFARFDVDHRAVVFLLTLNGFRSRGSSRPSVRRGCLWHIIRVDPGAAGIIRVAPPASSGRADHCSGRRRRCRTIPCGVTRQQPKYQIGGAFRGIQDRHVAVPFDCLQRLPRQEHC